MKAIYGAIGIVWLFSLAAGITSPIAASSAEITAQPLSAAGMVTDAPPLEWCESPDPRVDVLGNEVENAVADYRIDLGGAVYERHSPETAVPRLGSPTS